MNVNKATVKYNSRAQNVNSLLCVGLDPDFEKLPENFKTMAFPQFGFNKYIIDQTAEFVSAYKPNMAFYEARGEQGWAELKMTVEYLSKNHPDIFTICDAKRGDIGNTNNGYVKAIFYDLNFDAITLHPYLGQEGLKVFLERADKVCIILCRTSNPGAKEFQDLESGGKKLWQIVAEKVSSEWNFNHNCMLVAGATYPEELGEIREIVGEMTLLVPGVGAQGGDVELSVKAGVNSKKLGLIISTSRAVIFAENPAEEAKKLRDEINKYR
jgi:orotidine-5'-phosphate decarboxylase